MPFVEAHGSPGEPCLIRDPVQGVEGDDEVEFLLKGQMPGIGNLE